MKRYLLHALVVLSLLIPVEVEAQTLYEYTITHEWVELSQEIYTDWKYVEL